jgi:hypothetical protein
MAQALPCIGRHYNIACMKRVRSAFVDGRHRVAGASALPSPSSRTLAVLLLHADRRSG